MYIKASCRCLIYMLCIAIFIGAKVNHIVQRMQDRQTQLGES